MKTICKMPSQRMNWVCEGTNLWALNDKDGPMQVKGKLVVIRRDLIDNLCKNNSGVRAFAQRYGFTEFIEGPHMHLVWNDGMRGLSLNVTVDKRGLKL